MATTEQIFEFNASKGIDNIKNLRKEIKDLKSSLEQLEIGSEEYEKTSEKLWEKQSRLTDVMKESKRPLEDAAGSYNALNKELVELRKTYRALSEEQRNSDFGTDILLQIQSLDAKLKASDATMGQYFRNVGNYSNSIVDAFKQMGFASTSLDGPLKKVGVKDSYIAGNKYVEHAFAGISVAVCALLVQAVLKMGKSGVKDIFTAVVAVVSFVLTFVFDLSPIIIVILAGIAAVIFKAITEKKTQSSEKEEK